MRALLVVCVRACVVECVQHDDAQMPRGTTSAGKEDGEGWCCVFISEAPLPSLLSTTHVPTTPHPRQPPQESCAGNPFSESAISTIEPQMNQFWLSCPELGGKNVPFWTHEWSKHGLCTGFDELTFFTKVLALRQQYMSECDNSTSSCRLCFTPNLVYKGVCATPTSEPAVAMA